MKLGLFHKPYNRFYRKGSNNFIQFWLIMILLKHPFGNMLKFILFVILRFQNHNR
jgi:hypothetical protein